MPERLADRILTAAVAGIGDADGDGRAEFAVGSAPGAVLSFWSWSPGADGGAPGVTLRFSRDGELLTLLGWSIARGPY